MLKLTIELLVTAICGFYLGTKWKRKAKIITINKNFPVADIIDTENPLDKII